MTNLQFTEKDGWWVSQPLSGNSNWTFRLRYAERGKKSIIVETTILDTGLPWAPEADVVYYDTEWEKNVNGIAPGQKVRIKTNVNPLAGFAVGY